MPQQVVSLEATTVEFARQTAARIGNVVIQVPAMFGRTETALRDGLYAIKNAAGIPAPDAAPTAADNGAGNLTGTYSWHITFYDSTRDVEGDPETSGVSGTPSAEKVLVTNTATNNAANSRVSHWRIYRTLANATDGVYYFVAQVVIGTTTYDDDNTDASIQANDTLKLDNDAPVVETFGIAHAHKHHCFLAGCHNDIGGTAYDHRITWGKVNSVDQFPPLNERFVQNGMYGRITALGSIGDAFIVYKQFCIVEWHFDQDPSTDTGDGYAKVVCEDRGCLNKRMAVDVQGTHFVMDTKGIYVYRGGTDVAELAGIMEHYWQRINWVRADYFSAAASNDRVYFFVALDGETECRYAFVFDLKAWQTNPNDVRWYVYKWDFGIRDAVTHQYAPAGPSNSATLYGMANAKVVSVLTEFGFCGHLGAGYRDLLDPLLTAHGTATGGSTTTLADTGATFSRTNDASSTCSAKGAYLFIYRPNAAKPGSADWDGPYRVSGVSGTTLTFTPAAPSNVVSGMRYVLGRIPDAWIDSPQFGFDAPYRRKVAAKLAIEFQPQGVYSDTPGRNIALRVSADRKAASLAFIDLDTGAAKATKYDTGVELKLGGDQDEGRIGLHATASMVREGFYYMNYQLGADAVVDCPAVIDAVYVDGLQEVG